MVIEPLPGLLGRAGPLRVTCLATPNMARARWPPPPPGAAQGGAPDLPIMAARRGCRAEVTAARRGAGRRGERFKGTMSPERWRRRRLRRPRDRHR